MDNNYCVYIHINKINNKKYVGITKTSVSKRWGKNGSEYIRDESSVFGRAIVKYGWDNFYHEIFSTNLSKERACDLEVILIATLRTCDKRYGYNIQRGGQLGNAGVVFSEDSKEKMRQAKIGKKLTDEHKKHISESLQGHKPANFTDEVRMRLRLANIGKTIPNETREKISNTLTGTKRSEETKRKMSANRPNKRGVFCPQLNEYFETLVDVKNKYGISHGNIEKCLNGERKSAGKHPITGEKLTWVEWKK